jgi:hypothetical protein
VLHLVWMHVIDVVGEEKCATAVVTPGGEEFHFYAYSKPHLQTTMLGVGCGVTPGLHHPKKDCQLKQKSSLGHFC